MSGSYPIIILPPGARDRTEQMGTKEKFWFEHTDGRRWLFKFNRPGHGDDWSEKVAGEIAGLLRLPHAHVELATFENRLGVISRDFTDRGRLMLVHGNELLWILVDPKYPTGQNYRVTEHTVERVRGILDRDWVAVPNELRAAKGIESAGDAFAGYLMLDAVVGNTDRHHENWAVVVPIHDPNGAISHGAAELAPTFDHATCLGFSISDAERFDRMTPGRNRSVESFADKASSKLYLQVGAAKPLSPIAAFLEFTKDRPLARRAWIDRLSRLSVEAIRETIERVPAERMSRAARDFAITLIGVNRARIVGMG